MKHMYQRIIVMMLILLSVVSLLTGCSKEGGSDYPDNTVDVPSNYAEYSVPPMNFRYEAGWKSANFDSVQEKMDLLSSSLGINSNICIFMRLQSPAADQGTVNFLDLGYFQMNHEVSMDEMEGIMETMDALSAEVKQLSLSASLVQASKIRSYGEDDLEALTFSYRISTSVNDFTISCLEQIALIPVGTRIYVIIYSDFTSKEDTEALEQVLSTLQIEK